MRKCPLSFCVYALTASLEWSRCFFLNNNKIFLKLFVMYYAMNFLLIYSLCIIIPHNSFNLLVSKFAMVEKKSTYELYNKFITHWHDLMGGINKHGNSPKSKYEFLRYASMPIQWSFGAVCERNVGKSWDQEVNQTPSNARPSWLPLGSALGHVILCQHFRWFFFIHLLQYYITCTCSYL